MQKVIGAKRVGDKNLYYFQNSIDLVIGDKVVVEIEEFQTIVTVSRVNVELDDSKVFELPKIKRKASEGDLKKFTELQEKSKKDLVQIKKKSLELGLMMKFVNAEYSLDNSKVLIVFSSEERVDFRQFLKELASMLKTRIELKQIGQRDEVKIIGGVGPCGEPCCCARFLNDFEHVTVKMAKVQGLSLSPTKINGICGRLMCCLGYEAGTYEEILAKMPKINSEVVSPNGKGIAVYNDILRERVSVKRQAEGDTFVVEDFDLDDISFEGKPRVHKPEQKKVESNEHKNEHKKEQRNEHKKEQRKEEPKKQEKPEEQKLEVMELGASKSEQKKKHKNNYFRNRKNKNKNNM